MRITSTDIKSQSFSNLKDDEDIRKKIEDNIESAYSYFRENIENALSDINFALGNQWDASEIGEAYLRQKLMLTVNVLYAHVSQIIAEQAQNSPQIQVGSLDVNANQKVLSLYEGILRHIAYDSESDIAYQTAFGYAVLGGYGAWRVVLDYENERSHKQKIKIVPIDDIAKVYFDPKAKHPTKCDGEYCGIYTRLSLDEFFATYGDIENPESLMPPNTWSRDFNWHDNDGIVICEHFQKVWQKTKSYLMSNGDEVLEDEMADYLKEQALKMKEGKALLDNMMHQNTGHYLAPDQIKDKFFPKLKIISERDTEVPTIKWFKLIKGKILEESVFPGRRLPIVFNDGDSHYIDGKQVVRSLIKFSKDAQKFLNFVVSEIAQWIKVGHKGQFLATESQIGPYKELWRNPEKPSVALMYKPDAVTREKPTYIAPAELPTSLMAMPNGMVDMIQSILGRNDANMGSPGNERSGLAVANRAKQGNLSTYVYQKNLNISIEETARICMELIPYVYDSKRVVPITKADGTKDSTEINTNDDNTLKKGQYTVTVNIGASFEMQKADAFSQIMSLVSLNPQMLSTLLADLLAQNTNLDNTPQIVQRLRNFVVPPAVIAQEEGKQLPPQQPDPQMVIAQQEAQARLLEAQAKIAKVQQEGAATTLKTKAEIGKAQLDYQGKVIDNIAKVRQHALNHETAKFKAVSGMRQSI